MHSKLFFDIVTVMIQTFVITVDEVSSTLFVGGCRQRGGVYFSEPLLVPYLLVLFLSQAGSQAGAKWPYQSLPLTSSPSMTGWTPGSLCRRFNEMSIVDRLDFPPRHMLCSVTHGMGKKLLVANDLGDLTIGLLAVLKFSVAMEGLFSTV
ncbi:hypothetical protein AVEN_262525-1 [Araneus ventricosus]|uniref:Uncharacterized protein n=1 Tax=Araneus ventricosus TaxID=182803 RepID=A0A4Y2HYA8_ARAVE|nr:hypothetical protein AVEN_262525-1 [Araneus ventricosus]